MNVYIAEIHKQIQAKTTSDKSLIIRSHQNSKSTTTNVLQMHDHSGAKQNKSRSALNELESHSTDTTTDYKHMTTNIDNQH